MPGLDTSLHVDMLRGGKYRSRFAVRFKQAIRLLLGTDNVYGLEWGNPDVDTPLRYVRDHFLKPYVTPSMTVVEIGPGGGRWTRYMLHAKRIYAVDFYQPLLDELRSRFSRPNVTFVKNNGDDFPGIPDASVDFVFSFGAMVHMDVPIIDGYLRNIKRLLKPESVVLLHYSDKTKPLGARNGGFSQNDPETMRALVRSHGYTILEEDTGTMWHSSIVRLGLPGPA